MCNRKGLPRRIESVKLSNRVIGCAVIELKSVEEIKGIHEAQLLTYMKSAGVKTGSLINFNVTKLKDGIQRLVL